MLGHTPLKATFDTIIVGAGIVGAACAAECAQAGLKVLVLDRGPIGSGSTGAGMGHLVVMDDSEAQFALTNYSRQLWNNLAPELPPSIEYEQCGTLWIAADEQELTEVRRKAGFYTQRNVRVEVLDASQVASAEPHLRRGLVGGLEEVDHAFPGGWVVVLDAVPVPAVGTGQDVVHIRLTNQRANLSFVRGDTGPDGVLLFRGPRLTAVAAVGRVQEPLRGAHRHRAERILQTRDSRRSKAAIRATQMSFNLNWMKRIRAVVESLSHVQR